MTNYGYAMTLAAAALELATREPYRLHWCVDLHRDVGPQADQPVDPTNPYKAETHWGSLLQRMRAHLDAHPGRFVDGREIGPQPECRVGLMVRHTLASSGAKVQTVYNLPYRAWVWYLAKGPPPVGQWLIWPEPPGVRMGPHKLEVDQRVGDSMPDSFWFDGIPF